ncbi:MAG: GntR family transcriptional regulator [Pseudaminobacter sp.]|nr:GntR family transcriptional regulator [Pseudaminobacter sp.]
MTSFRGFSPLAPRPVHTGGGATERIVDALREAIVTLEIAPGAALDKPALAARFGVSRFPVAEAFNRLKAEGLVDIRPQSGSTVSLIRLSDVRENMFLRRALEGEAAALLAARADGGLFAEIERNLRYQKSAVEVGDRPGFHRLDLEFHDLLISAVGYPRMRATVEHARLALDRVRRLLATPRRHGLSLAEHAAIYEALRSANPDAARAAMAAHIDSVMVELEAFSLTHPEAFADQAR